MSVSKNTLNQCSEPLYAHLDVSKTCSLKIECVEF